MLSVSAAQSQILARIPSPAPPEVVTVAGALGRVLAEDVRSTTDVPPADNSAVDGYAVGAADIPRTGTRPLDVVADLPAGTLYAETLKPGQALRIMTGAPIPGGADTVYPQEVVTRSGPRIEVPPIDAGANVRYRGEDVRAGAVVLGAGAVVRPRRWASPPRSGSPGSSCGSGRAWPSSPRAMKSRSPAASARPHRSTTRIASPFAGSSRPPAPSPPIAGSSPTASTSFGPSSWPPRESHDVVLTSGGVSVGDHDLVKAVLQDTGSIDFWQVAMQPGRPVAVGRIRGAHFFGLPGNPVATMLTFHLFVRPALWKLAGRRELDVPRFRAVAAEPMKKKRGRREFKRGLLTYRDPHWEVTTTGPQGSGILTSMTEANCLIIIEEDAGDVALGDPVWVEPFTLS